MKSPVKCAELWCCFAALLFPSLRLPAQQATTQQPNPQLEQAKRTVKDLAKRFPEILAQAPDEASMRARMASVGAEIQRCVDNYIVSLPATPDRGLNRKFVASQLFEILSSVEDRPPHVFVFTSRHGNALLIFDNVQNGRIGSDSSYAALTAFNVEGQRLIESDSTGGDMDGYWVSDIKELPSPAQGEIWLLFSGTLTGANGPNSRMRIFAYDGKKFRTVWAPANAWGDFTTQVISHGFVVSGDYYESNQHRYDHYHLASDGLYWLPKDK